MQRPAWATILGILFICIGGCGSINSIKLINADKTTAIANEVLSDIDSESNNQTNPIDSNELKILSMFGDSIYKDSLQNVDIAKTLKSFIHISEYRIKWMLRFGIIGLILGLCFIVSGIVFFSRKTFTVPLALLVLVLGIALGIFKLMVYASDSTTGKMINMGENVSIYFGLFFYTLLLIVLMVIDKSYYQEKVEIEDYYE